MSQLLSDEAQSKLLSILRTRFEKFKSRHQTIKWTDVENRLLAHPDKLAIIDEMERTGGEPDVVSFDKKTGVYTFFDCSPESPKERRSLCYDRQALDGRKENKPKNSALDLAEELGIALLDEEQYVFLQTLGDFDLKTSSWLKTDPEVRKKGGAIFGDKRYGRTFLYHNGAESYYAARGFRGFLEI